MSKDCTHNIPETKRGAGACQIKAEVKLRNGKPNWWCHTHGLAAGAPDGNALERCPGAWLDPVEDDMRVELDLRDGQVAVWGALAPAISIGSVPDEPGKVHVHRRRSTQAAKDIDRSYDIVVLRSGVGEVAIEGMPAVAYSISELSGRDVTALRCPHCGSEHIDEKMFATFPHRKHLCNGCGRNFRDSSGPSISNPLTDVGGKLGVPTAPPPVRAAPTLQLQAGDYDGIALWPSNAAIFNNMTRPEEEGIHVHAWQQGQLVVDDTYAQVTLDGDVLDEQALRALQVQRALAEGAPIVDIPCAGCGAAFVSPTGGYTQPTTSHTCPSCGHLTKTRRKSFLNPLAASSPTRQQSDGQGLRELITMSNQPLVPGGTLERHRNIAGRSPECTPRQPAKDQVLQR